MPRPYNVTELSTEMALDRCIVHRDYAAHCLRWSFVLHEAKIGDRVVDFGCGSAALLETLYRNRYRPEWYVGIDIRERVIEENKGKFANLPFPVTFLAQDLIDPYLDPTFAANRVVSFEVLEHVGKQNADAFLKHFGMCGGEDATYYLSTPNYDPDVGAAANHTYDSGDGRGVAPHEWDHWELYEKIQLSGFQVVRRFGTFASQRDYKPALTPEQQVVFKQLREYYDSNMVSVIMAPIVPPHLARNTLWVLKRPQTVS